MIYNCEMLQDPSRASREGSGDTGRKEYSRFPRKHFQDLGDSTGGTVGLVQERYRTPESSLKPQQKHDYSVQTGALRALKTYIRSILLQINKEGLMWKKYS